MNENNGFIKIHRKILTWEWYDDVNTCRMFIHCLLKSNWKSGSWHGIKYNAGEFITSLQTLAKETHLTVSQVRVALNHLKMTGEIADRRHGNARIITVIKWNDYQLDDRPNDKPVTDQSQANDKPVTTDEEYKKGRREEGKKNTIGSFFPNDEILNNAFNEFLKMRKQIKKPMGDHAIKLAIKKLETLSGGDNDLAVKIINQSIMGSWQGLYPLKNETEKSNKDNDIINAWKNA